MSCPVTAFGKKAMASLLLGITFLLSSASPLSSAWPLQRLETGPSLGRAADLAAQIPLEPDRAYAETVHWGPRPGKYLLLYCTFGRLSNQVGCLQNHLHLAALLNRTLLVPSEGVLFFHGRQAGTWNMDLVVDWERMRQCLAPAYGASAVMRVKKYLEQYSVEAVNVSRAYCASKTVVCITPGPHEALLQAMNQTLKFPPLSSSSDWVLPSKLTGVCPATDAQILQAWGGVEEDVLCAGDLFQLCFERKGRVGTFDFTRPPACNDLWRPHRVVTEFADSLASSKLGAQYGAIHLRRGDFYFESTTASPGTAYAGYRSITEAAEMVADVLKRTNLETLYVATDASSVELQLFSQVLIDETRIKSVVSLHSLLSDLQRSPPDWSRPFFELARAEGAEIPFILLDKALSAKSTLFIGTWVSSFSRDILYTRCREKRVRGTDGASLRCSTTKCTPMRC